MKRLWGDQFFNAKDKKWNKTGGEGFTRGFCQFVLDPIFKVRQWCMNTHHIMENISISLGGGGGGLSPVYRGFWRRKIAS